MPVAPGRPARHDYEYKRNGTANLFMLFAPLEGWRHVKPTARRTAVDYAHVLKEVSDVHFPRAPSDHRAGSGQPGSTWRSGHPCPVFTLRGASHTRRSTTDRRALRWHYSPKHGSWLNMAEAELGRIHPGAAMPRTGASPMSRHSSNRSRPGSSGRNKHHAKADWRFTTQDARIKLKNLYPVF